MSKDHSSSMPSRQPLNQLLRRLWRHVSLRRRKQFGLLLVLMVLASFAEILSIGSVIPFLGVLTAPDRVFGLPLAQPFIRFAGLTSPGQLLLPLTVAFGVAALMAGMMRLLLLWASTRLSFATGADLSVSIYNRTLYQPNAVHIARNSSDVINGILVKANGVIYQVIGPTLAIISSTVMLDSVLVALISVEPVIALVAFSGFGVIYAFIVRLTRKRLLNNGQSVARESTPGLKSLHEGLGCTTD